VAEGIQVFDFRFGAELSAPRRRTLTLASQRREPSFHIAIAHFGIKQDLLEGRQVGMRSAGERKSGSETISASGVPPRL